MAWSSTYIEYIVLTKGVNEANTESQNWRCNTVGNVYGNEGCRIIALKLQRRALGWIFGWFLDEFLDECDLQKFVKNSKTRKKVKENAKTKIMLGIRTTPYDTQIHEINKMVIRHLWLSLKDKNQLLELRRTSRHQEISYEAPL